MPFNWTLNPYRGCTHGCHYCFARRYHAQFEMNADDEFASVILVKTQLRRGAGAGARSAVVEAGAGRARHRDRSLSADRGPLPAHASRHRSAGTRRTPVGLVTKGPMVVRDRDVLLDLARAAGCTVYMSVPTVDEDAWRTLEPGTAHPLQRLRAVRELVDAGINAGVLMAPIVPGFSSSRSKLERTIKAIADHGARFVGCNVMHLQDGTRAHFMKFIEREFPAMLPRFERLVRQEHTRRQPIARRRKAWSGCCRTATASRRRAAAAGRAGGRRGRSRAGRIRLVI